MKYASSIDLAEVIQLSSTRSQDSTIRLLAIRIFDLGQIEKTGTIFFQLILEIRYKNQVNNLITCL